MGRRCADAAAPAEGAPAAKRPKAGSLLERVQRRLVKKESSVGCLSDQASAAAAASGAETDVECCEKFDKKTLAEFNHKLGKTPKFIRDYYDGKLKWAKTSSSAEKTTFVKEILQADDFTCDYFKKMNVTEQKSAEWEEGHWISWGDVLKKDLFLSFFI